MIYLISIFITALPLLFSCTEDKSAINFGGDGRNNNYEDRSLYSSDYFVYEILSDSLSENNTEGLKWPMLMMKNGKIIWCGRDNKVKMLAGSAFRWKYDLENERIISPFSISPEHDIIFLTSDNSINSLNKNGQLNWKKSLENKNYNSILALKKYFIVINSDGNILFFNYSGDILSELKLPLSPIGSPSKVNDSTVIITSSHFLNGKSDSVYVLQNKKIKSTFGIQNSRIIVGGISSDEKIFLSTLKSKNNENIAFVTSFDINGNIIWEQNIDNPAVKLSSDREGNLFCLSRENGLNDENNWIIKIDKNGGLAWKLFFDNYIGSQLLIGENNIVFFATRDKTQGLYYINKKSGELYSILSFSQAPDLNPFCVISEGGMIYFGANDEDKIIKIEKDMLDWR